jgi:hypothetical protein
MATPHLFCGYRRQRRLKRSRARFRRAATLLELIVVLFIIGIMASLLFPALQAARSKADTAACQNNVRQVGFALARAIDVMNRFPQANHWTIDCLRFMEERPLYDQMMANGIPPGAVYPRPKLFQCLAQPEFSSAVANVGVCHYVLVVDRPTRRDNSGRVSWDLLDRPRLSDNGSEDPWYIGPEISFAERQNMLATMKGPHLSGIYYTHRGETLGGE